MKKLRVGVVGARYDGVGKPGNIGGYHVRNIEESNLGKVVAISRTTQEGADKTIDFFHRTYDDAVCGAYSDPIRMFDLENLDLVYICTPSQHHLPLIEAALEREISIVSEKPLTAVDLTEKDVVLQYARKLINLSKERGLYFGVVNQYATLTDRIRNILKQEGKNGRMESISMYIESQAGRKGKEIIIDLYPHVSSIIKRLIEKDGSISEISVDFDKEGQCKLMFEYGNCICEVDLVQSTKTKSKRLPNIEFNGQFKIQFLRERKEEYSVALVYKSKRNGRLISESVGDPLRILDNTILTHLLNKRNERKPPFAAKYALKDLEEMFKLVEAIA